jgi:hypothetical protein
MASRESSLKQVLDQTAWTRQIDGPERLSGENPQYNRADVIALGASPSSENLSKLFQVIVAEVGENNRESAIKGLAHYGGEFVAYQLETIAHRGDSARYAQSAAIKALEALGLAPKKELIFNPDLMNEIFKGGIISRTTTEPFRGNQSMANVMHFNQLDGDMVGFPLGEAQRFRFDFQIDFDFDRALSRFSALGLSVTQLHAKALQVEGDSFPGFVWKKPRLNVIFRIQNDGPVSVFSDAIPNEADCRGYQAVARLVARLAVWGGGKRAQKEVEKQRTSVPRDTDSSNEGLMDLAAGIGNGD